MNLDWPCFWNSKRGIMKHKETCSEARHVEWNQTLHLTAGYAETLNVCVKSSPFCLFVVLLKGFFIRCSWVSQSSRQQVQVKSELLYVSKRLDVFGKLKWKLTFGDWASDSSIFRSNSGCRWRQIVNISLQVVPTASCSTSFHSDLLSRIFVITPQLSRVLVLS